MRWLAAFAAGLWLAGAAGAEEHLPIITSTRPVVSIQDGDSLRKDWWRLEPEASPDVYEADLVDGMPRKVTFITDVEAITFDVEEGRQYDFIIRHGNDLCLTRIVGVRAIPAATFDARYQATHRGKISVEVPEAYELVNVALALTATGLADTNLVYQKSPYYAEMRKWFDPYRGHPAIAAFDAALRQNPSAYFTLKMNGYAFELDENGRLAPSPVYDRTGFVGERRNSLRPFIEKLQSFADDAHFGAFYRAHRATYDEEIGFFTGTADIRGMLAWLDRNFPRSSGYGSYRVIFSPLVAYNQSATWLESNGFRELQAHVNYPYPADLQRLTKGARLSRKGEVLLRGAIVFTELNHGYINPQADRQADRVLEATSNRDLWVDPAKGPGYYGGISAFNEYMNWALVSLRVVDLAPRADRKTLIGIVDEMMTARRGFPQFAAFDAFLVELYRRRPPGRTIADLYPQIIAWFAAHNAQPAPR